MPRFFNICCITVLLLCTLCSALPPFFSLTPYAPTSAQCPTIPLTRTATGLSREEQSYRAQRSAKAAENLRMWFEALNTGLPANETFPTDTMPVIGLASSGGSVRSLLLGAGIVQTLDNRDPDGPATLMKGLWQGITYHTGLDGGSWLVAALAGNSGATVKSLLDNVWISGFADATLLPANLRSSKAYSTIAMDCTAKAIAGYPPTLVDTWGRLLSQNVFMAEDGGIKTTLSGLVNTSGFQNHEMPYPIVTALGVSPATGQSGCVDASTLSTQIEFHPFEFGSWDVPVREFSQTRFMGSPLVDNGMALASSTCLNGYDNLGFLLGSSANDFNYFCGMIPTTTPLLGQLGELQNDLISVTAMIHGLSFYDEYGVIPSPFTSASPISISNPSENIYLVNGGQGGENIPLAPLIQPERGVDVVIANDNSADTADFWPNGTSLYHTYLRALEVGPSILPAIPSPDVFVAHGLNKRPTFFGCNDSNKITIVYLPNAEHDYPSNTPDWRLGYNSSAVMGLISSGNQIANMNATCLGCVLLLKSRAGGGLPASCKSCFAEYCWNA